MPTGTGSLKRTVQFTVGILFGGAGGNRTPVRKQLDRTFSGRRRLFPFPRRGVNRHTTRLGSFIVHGALKALRTHGHHSTTPHPGSWSFRAGRPLIKQRRERRYRCSLIYKLPVLRWPGATARYSCLRVPVETGTPPHRRSKLHIPRFAASGKARSFRCSSSPNRTRLRWAPVWPAAPPPGWERGGALPSPERGEEHAGSLLTPFRGRGNPPRRSLRSCA